MFLCVSTFARRLASAACFALFVAPTLVSAVPVKWTITDATFDDGGTISGYFVYDSDTQTLGERSIAVAGGNVGSFPPRVYDNAGSLASYESLGNPQPTLVMQINGTFRQLRITPSAALTGAGGTLPLNLQTADNGSGGIECFNCGPSRRIVTGKLVGSVVGDGFIIKASLAGNWFDPAQDGHGFQFEVLPGGVATVFWFTFDNAGNQVWINGAGTIEGNRVVMNGGRVLNGRFPPNFNPAALERRAWGTLTFTFTDCTHGKVDWTSTDPAFTSTGTMNLIRLTTLSGLSCP